MPTLISIQAAEHDLFTEIRAILNHPKDGVGFAVTSEYLPDLKIAKFKFDDTKYIPEAMYEFMQVIPGNDGRVKICNKKIEKVLKDWNR